LQILLSAILVDFAAGQTFYRACPLPSEHFVVVVAGVWVYPCTHSITTFKGPQVDEHFVLRPLQLSNKLGRKENES